MEEASQTSNTKGRVVRLRQASDLVALMHAKSK